MYSNLYLEDESALCHLTDAANGSNYDLINYSHAATVRYISAIISCKLTFYTISDNI